MSDGIWGPLPIAAAPSLKGNDLARARKALVSGKRALRSGDELSTDGLIMRDGRPVCKWSARLDNARYSGDGKEYDPAISYASFQPRNFVRHVNAIYWMRSRLDESWQMRHRYLEFAAHALKSKDVPCDPNDSSAVHTLSWNESEGVFYFQTNRVDNPLDLTKLSESERAALDLYHKAIARNDRLQRRADTLFRVVEAMIKGIYVPRELRNRYHIPSLIIEVGGKTLMRSVRADSTVFVGLYSGDVIRVRCNVEKNRFEGQLAVGGDWVPLEYRPNVHRW